MQRDDAAAEVPPLDARPAGLLQHGGEALLVGPGARALPLMRGEIEAALSASLVCSINGLPQISAHLDEKEPIFRGLMMKTLDALDQEDMAALDSSVRV